MKPASQILDWLPECIISPKGIFKYIVIKGTQNGSNEVLLVRGDAKHSYHSENFQGLKKELKELGCSQVKGNDDKITAVKDGSTLEFVCIGGGRIEHQYGGNICEIYGYSQSYGKIDHEIARKIISNHMYSLE